MCILHYGVECVLIYSIEFNAQKDDDSDDKDDKNDKSGDQKKEEQETPESTENAGTLILDAP